MWEKEWQEKQAKEASEVSILFILFAPLIRLSIPSRGRVY